MKKIKEKIKEYRPDKNSVKTDIDEKLSWKIKPKKDYVNFDLKFSKVYEEDEVEIVVKIGGEVNYFSSPKGTKDVIQSASFSATKKF